MFPVSDPTHTLPLHFHKGMILVSMVDKSDDNLVSILVYIHIKMWPISFQSKQLQDYVKLRPQYFKS